MEIIHGRFFSKLFDKRQASDYSDFIDFNEEDVLPLISEAKALLKAVFIQLQLGDWMRKLD